MKKLMRKCFFFKGGVPDFKFEDMGIGGLNSEISMIFRYAFASRIYPHKNIWRKIFGLFEDCTKEDAICKQHGFGSRAGVSDSHLEVHMEIGLPDEQERLQILKIHTSKTKINDISDKDVDLEELASLTKNFRTLAGVMPDVEDMKKILSGPSSSGKTALAATMAMTSEFPFIKLISPESMVGYSKSAKITTINKPLPIKSGFFNKLDMSDCFNSEIEAPNIVDLSSIELVFKRLPLFNNDEKEQSLETLNKITLFK
ncbi:9580_t:CDS:10 [Entrophospora sp. SA101]|nr:9580_t:CDS:10 [Entrophospora sp. SA101]